MNYMSVQNIDRVDVAQLADVVLNLSPGTSQLIVCGIRKFLIKLPPHVCPNDSIIEEYTKVITQHCGDSAQFYGFVSDANPWTYVCICMYV